MDGMGLILNIYNSKNSAETTWLQRPIQVESTLVSKSVLPKAVRSSCTSHLLTLAKHIIIIVIIIIIIIIIIYIYIHISSINVQVSKCVVMLNDVKCVTHIYICLSLSHCTFHRPTRLSTYHVLRYLIYKYHHHLGPQNVRSPTQFWGAQRGLMSAATCYWQFIVFTFQMTCHVPVSQRNWRHLGTVHLKLSRQEVRFDGRIPLNKFRFEVTHPKEIQKGVIADF